MTTDPLLPVPASVPAPARSRWWRHPLVVHVLCLAATFVTTTYAGGWHDVAFRADFGQALPTVAPVQFWLGGLWFSLSVLGILGAHEWGHYLACRWYRVDASLPYFLPAPLPLTGTFGAFIRIRNVIPHSRALFDIGASGPFAGFVVAVPLLVLGLWLSRLVPVPVPEHLDLIELGEPLLFRAVEAAVWGALPDGQMLNLHPMALAAWFGLLATALNLFPLAQLDGGHLAYAVVGHHARWITLGTAAAALGLTFVSISWVAWAIVMIGVLVVAGVHHPPTLDDQLPLGRPRLALAAAAALVFALCFTPAPVTPIGGIVPDLAPASSRK
jgi:membrane-associated protease RseP (regulator of RpoE activity)